MPRLPFPALRVTFAIGSGVLALALIGCGDDEPADDASTTAGAGASGSASGASSQSSAASGSPCTETTGNADHCGACNQPCADIEVCLDATCVPGGGDGTSCESPVFWDVEAEEQAGFKMWPALSTEHTFSCGPASGVATRWFRFLAPKDETSVEVQKTTDDYILEVFAAASCDASSFLGCNDNQAAGDVLPKLDVDTTEGTTIYVAVGVLGTWSGVSAQLRVDH
jgi:hypothetical protein